MNIKKALLAAHPNAGVILVVSGDSVALGTVFPLLPPPETSLPGSTSPESTGR